MTFAAFSHVCSGSRHASICSPPRSVTIMAQASMVAINPATKAAALSFFNSVRTPATLIAGSSIVALFSLAGRARDTSASEKGEIVLLRIYHTLALLSFCLSISTILTSTAAGTKLLLSTQRVNNGDMDVYHFLKEVLPFEFIFTRWAFLSSLILFVGCVTGRLLLEFDLLSEKRKLAGVTVVSTMLCVVSWMISYVNESLHCWPNLWAMTVDVAKLLGNRCRRGVFPMQVVSGVFFVIALICSVKFLYPPTAEQDRLADAEGYL